MGCGEIAEKAAGYLRIADRLLPGWISGFYVVGSAALGEYVGGRSDLDFVAVVANGLNDAGVRRLRLLHWLAGAQSAANMVAQRHRPTSGTPNGVFVREADLALPVTKIQPVASTMGPRFALGRAFDVNPVVWKVFSERGLTFRGEQPSSLRLDPEPEFLKLWNVENLDAYWRPWGERVSQGGRSLVSSELLRYGSAWTVAWGALGAPRLHCTIATGEVVGKLSAARYTLQTFEEEWHPIIEQGWAYGRGKRVKATLHEAQRAGEFVLAVIESARSL